ncbi:TPA: hypothetical protein DCX15_03370 [bacterium]|nr:hypothetical protein [bacterium]
MFLPPETQSIDLDGYLRVIEYFSWIGFLFWPLVLAALVLFLVKKRTGVPSKAKRPFEMVFTTILWLTFFVLLAGYSPSLVSSYLKLSWFTGGLLIKIFLLAILVFSNVIILGSRKDEFSTRSLWAILFTTTLLIGIGLLIDIELKSGLLLDVTKAPPGLAWPKRVEIKKCQAIIEKEPLSERAARAHYKLGLIYMEKEKDPSNALEEWRNFLSFPSLDKKTRALGQLKLAKTYLCLKEYPQAIETFEDIIKDSIDPSLLASAYEELAKLYQEDLKDYEKAIESWKGYLKLKGLEPSQYGTAASNILECYYQSLRFEECLNFAKELLNKKKKEKFGYKIWEIERRIEFIEKNPDYDYEPLRLYVKKDFEGILERYPNSNLATEVLTELGKRRATEETKRFYEEIIKRHPQTKAASSARDYLKKMASQD